MGSAEKGGRVYHTPTHFPDLPHFPNKPKKLDFLHFQISRVIISCSMFGPLESFEGKRLVFASSYGFCKKKIILFLLGHFCAF